MSNSGHLHLRPPSAVVRHQKTIQHYISLQILLADRLINSTKQLESSKFDFTDVTELATELAHLLRSTARLVAGTTASFYHRPLLFIFSDVSSNLQQAQTLVRKCKHRSGILRRVFATTTTSSDVREVSTLLESSVADVKWLLSIFITGENTGDNLSLPPIATKNPILAWVWSNIATVQHSTRLEDRVDAVNSLWSLSADNDRNKKLIIEEGGLPPLLKLLKDGTSSESQIAAATTLYNLGTDQEQASTFLRSLAVPTIVQVLNDSTTVVVVRTNLINLVSRMCEMGSWVQDEFGKENVVRSIVTFLAKDIVFDDYGSSSSLPFYNKKETELGSLEERLKLKISCGRALWMLAKGSLLNSRKITETKALICFAKLIDQQETEDLQVNCLMTVMELAKVAESNAEFRRQAFKPNSPAARAVLHQLLRIMNHETNPKLVVPAINTVGSLARTFPAKETRILGPLVSKLDHEVSDIANEAVMALIKFVDSENFNCVEHSKVILEFDGVMNFLKNNDNIKIHQVQGARLLLCYLTLHHVVGNSRMTTDVEQCGALSVIEGAAQSMAMIHNYPNMKEILGKAIHHLNLNLSI